MGKRKDVGSLNGLDSDDDASIIDVEFEWFNPQEIDFHGVKTLVKQLFDVDNTLLDCSGLANLVITQPQLGSTVKVSDELTEEAKNNDPFAFLTVLNIYTHQKKPEIQALVSYLQDAATQTPSLATTLPPLLASTSPEAQVGLVLNERLINMPAQIVPPMYTMLLEEVQWAIDEGEPYNFTHYLVMSKTYREITSKLDTENGGSIVYEDERDTPKKKKRRGAATESAGETFYFHPEDEVLQKFALGHGTFAYRKEGDEGASDAKRAFQEAGIKPMGHMILLEATRFKDAVEAIKSYIGAN